MLTVFISLDSTLSSVPEFVQGNSSSGRSGVRQLEVRVGGEQGGEVGVAVLPGGDGAEAEADSEDKGQGEESQV